jgi:glycosyltransferase involved in cell wall biosynthesis
VLSHPRISFILVHDFQEVDTQTELRRFLENNNPRNVEFIEGHFHSPGVARNQGIPRVTTQWVTFWDSDDEPQLERVIKFFDSRNPNTPSPDLIIGNYATKTEKGHLSTHKMESNLREVALNPGLWRIIFKTEVLKNNRFEDFLMAEDQVFLAGICLPSRVIEFTPEVFYIYISHHNGQLTKSSEALKDLHRSTAKMFELLQNKVVDQEFVLILLIRQLLTGLKNFRNRQRLNFLKNATLSVVRGSPQNRQLIIKAFIFIVLRLVRVRSTSINISQSKNIWN